VTPGCKEGWKSAQHPDINEIEKGEVSEDSRQQRESDVAPTSPSRHIVRVTIASAKDTSLCQWGNVRSAMQKDNVLSWACKVQKTPHGETNCGVIGT
jgi:hypothetical protein